MVDTLTDKEGFLIDPSQWDKETAEKIAMKEGITLTDDHWEIITLLREHYAAYEHIPPMRSLCKVVKAALGPEKASSIYLHKLFPGGPVKQGCRISGLPKPPHCL